MSRVLEFQQQSWDWLSLDWPASHIHLLLSRGLKYDCPDTPAPGAEEGRDSLCRIILPTLGEKNFFSSKEKVGAITKRKGKRWLGRIGIDGLKSQWGQRRGVVEGSEQTVAGGVDCHQRVGCLNGHFGGGAVSGDDRVQGVAQAVGGRKVRMSEARECVPLSSLIRMEP